MSDTLKRIEELLNDDAALERNAIATQKVDGHDSFSVNTWKDVLIKLLQSYSQYIKKPVRLSSSWKCIIKANNKIHPPEIDLLICNYIEDFLDALSENKGLFDTPLFPPADNCVFYHMLKKENNHLRYTRSSRLNANKQNAFFSQGLMEDIFDQLDDVLLEDYRQTKHFCGQGGFGVVTLAEDKNGKRVILKKLSLENNNWLVELKNILKIREMTKSKESIVRIFDIGVDVEELSSAYAFYTMEAADDLNVLCPDSYGWYQPFTLDYLLKEQEFLKSPERIMFLLNIFINICQGINDLHTTGLIHRDIKPANIAIFNGRAKIIDLGLVTSTDNERIIGGTRLFCPEEVLAKQRPQTQADDIYALGKLMYTLLTLLPPERYPEYPQPLQDLNYNWLDAMKITITRACSTVPEERFQTLQEFLKEMLQSFEPKKE